MIPGLNIPIIDGVIIGLALILGIVGLAKGFSKQLFALFGTLLVIVGAVLLSNVLADVLKPLLGNTIQTPLTEWMTGLDEGADIKWFTEAHDWTDIANVQYALTKLGLPAFLSGIVAAPIQKVFASFGTAKLVEVLPPVMTQWALVAISFLLLVIVFSIVLALCKKLFAKATEIKLIGILDRLIGLVFGVAQAYLLILAVFTVLSFIPNTFLPQVQEAIRQQIDSSEVATWLFANNWLCSWILSFVG